MRGPPRPSYGCHLPGGSASPTRGKNLSGFGPPNHPAQRLHLLRAPAKPTRFSHLLGRGRQDTQHHAFTMGGGPPNQHGLPTNGRGLHTTQHHVFTFEGVRQHGVRVTHLRGFTFPPTHGHAPSGCERPTITGRVTHQGVDHGSPLGTRTTNGGSATRPWNTNPCHPRGRKPGSVNSAPPGGDTATQWQPPTRPPGKGTP